MKRIKILVLLGAAVAACAAVVWWLTRADDADPAAMLHGNVDIRQVSLAFNATGRIAELAVREGERVRAGQLLGRLDVRALNLQAAQARARVRFQEQGLVRLRKGNRPEEIAQARSRVVQAVAEHDRAAKNLSRLTQAAAASGGRAVAAQDLESAATQERAARAALEGARQAYGLVAGGSTSEDIEQARAQLAMAQAELDLIEHQLAEARLTAPVDAVVRARLVEPGDMVSPQRPAYTLALDQPKWVRAYASEAQLARLRPGQKVDVLATEQEDAPVEGTVGYISSVAEFTPKTVQTEELRSSLVYEVRINVADPGDRLRMGMPATVRLRSGRKGGG